MSSDSSDEAPDEISFNEAKISTLLKEKNRKRSEAEQRQLERQKRRERDQRLKEQQQSHKRKLLSEILKEAEDDEENEDEDQGAEIDTKELKTKLKAPKKKTFEDRDGIRIQVLEKPARVTKKKRLPPAGIDAVRKREQFLYRDSIPRK